MPTLFMPEVCYTFTPLSKKQIRKAKWNNKTIIGYVEEVYQDKQYVTVRLHQDILAILPYSELSIYGDDCSDSYNDKIAYVLKGKNICVKVTQINDFGIYVSRRKNMLEALSYLKKYDYAICYVFHTTPNCASADIGHGIIGYLPASEITVSYIKSIYEYINRGTILKLKILNFNKQNIAYVSYHQALPKMNVKIGNFVNCTITGKINEHPIGYFALVDPTLSGIVDKTDSCPDLSYGDCIRCKIVGETQNGLKLRFKEVISMKHRSTNL